MNKFKIATIVGLVVSLSASMLPRAKMINSRNTNVNYNRYFDINTDF